jgi:hypothetical protein
MMGGIYFPLNRAAGSEHRHSQLIREGGKQCEQSERFQSGNRKTDYEAHWREQIKVPSAWTHFNGVEQVLVARLKRFPAARPQVLMAVRIARAAR